MPRIKVIWGGASQAPGHWRLGLWGVFHREVGQPARMAVSVRGVLLWLGGLSLAGYLAGTTALFFWFNRSAYNRVRWTDTLLLPARWQHVRGLLGQAMIAEGLDDLRAKRWSEAHMKLRIGLARWPHDARARLALAEFYVAANRRPNAIEVLTEGLDSGYPGRRYLTTLFAIATQGEDYDTIVEACDRFVAGEATDRSWLLAQKISALIGAGRPAEALQMAEAEGDNATPMIREGRVLALIEAGRSSDAIPYLDAWLRAAPASRAQVLRLRVRACREAGRLDQMDEALEDLRRLEPADPRTLVYKIVQKHLAGQAGEAADALTEFFSRFSSSPQNLMLAAGALVEAKAPRLVQRCANEAALHGFRAMPFQLMLLEAQATDADWAGATQTVAELRPAMKTASAVEQFTLNWLQRLVAVASQSDAAPAPALLELFQERPLPMRMYRQTCEALVKAGRFETTRSVLLLARRSYPSSRTLETLGKKVEQAMTARQATVDAAAVATAPGAAAAEGERPFFKRLEEQEQAERWAEAAQALREVRLQKPEWFSRREGDVLEAQMRVAVHTDDALEMLGAAKLYLRGQRERALRVVSLARESAAGGHQRAGELLVQEVLREHPEFPPALRLKKEWEPRPKS